MERPRVLKPKEILRPLNRRFTMIPHMVLAIAMAWAAFLDKSGSFQDPKFTPIFDWASLEVWGAAFGLAGLLAIIAIVTASWRSYVAANILTLGLSLVWFVTLISARFQLGYEVSTHNYGLWGFIISTCIVLAITPTRVTRTR